MSELLDYGHFDIVLAEYLQERQISKKQISRRSKFTTDTAECILQKRY